MYMHWRMWSRGCAVEAVMSFSYPIAAIVFKFHASHGSDYAIGAYRETRHYRSVRHRYNWIDHLRKLGSTCTIIDRLTQHEHKRGGRTTTWAHKIPAQMCLCYPSVSFLLTSRRNCAIPCHESYWQANVDCACDPGVCIKPVQPCFSVSGVE